MAQFDLPDVGEGLTEAEIVSWKVQPGDEVAVNDVLVEIETAKSLIELPSPFAGNVTELMVDEGRAGAGRNSDHQRRRAGGCRRGTAGAPHYLGGHRARAGAGRHRAASEGGRHPPRSLRRRKAPGRCTEPSAGGRRLHRYW